MLNRKTRLIFITGGLGPTEADRTLDVLSKLTGRRIIVDEKIVEIIAKRRNISVSQVPPHFLRMSSTIEGAECFPNPVGLAPLTILRMGESIIFTMPGPPKEVQGCFTTYLAKEIEKITNYHSIAKRVLITMFEAEAAPIISQIHKTIPGIYVKPLVGEYVANVGLPAEIVVFDNNEEACQKKYRETVGMLTELVKKRGKEVKEV